MSKSFEGTFEMFAICSMKKPCGPLVFLTLALGVGTTPSLFAQAASPAPQAAAEPSHQPPVSARLNALAHKVLAAGLKTNALAGDDLKPWHLKVDYQMNQWGSPKPVSGSWEEWNAGQYLWRRTYSSVIPKNTGSEWSVTRFQRYQSKPGEDGFDHSMLNLRIARPVIEPLYQTTNIKPDYEMEIKRVTTGGVALNCVAVADPGRYVPNADLLFSTMCFDANMHLRLTVAGDTSVQFEDIQMFQNRAVPRDVKIIEHGVLTAEMKVSLLEQVDAPSPDLFKPAKDALFEPYLIEGGQQQPEPVYEVAAHLPLSSDGKPFRGNYDVPVVIRKDGTVKARADEVPGWWERNLKDALIDAINKWKFKPYLVDGQPVDVGYSIAYNITDKPFVPSYDQPKPAAVVTSPDDYSSAYDPKRKPEADLLLAEAAAHQGHKRILLEVGGDWCGWCKILDKFLVEHPDLHDLLDANFVRMKVNMSSSNENAAFLSQFPKIPGYPWIFVLDADGKLVAPEDTNKLENGAGSYNAKAIKDFLLASKGQ
jgi:hypothetical protein